MSDLDPIFLTALAERARGDVHVEQLLAGARRRGVRRVRIRRAVVTAGAACTVLAVLVAVALLPRSRPVAPPVTTPTTPSVSTSKAPPSVAPGQSLRRPERAPGLRALTDGGTLGEGLQLHVDTADPEARQLSWTSSEGVEILQVFRGGDTSPLPYVGYTVRVSSSDSSFNDGLNGPSRSEELALDGGTATLDYTGDWARLRWSLRSNAWGWVNVRFQDRPATAEAARAAVREIAGWVRIDQVLRCGVPFRLNWVPAGAQAVSCGAAADAVDAGRQTTWIELPDGSAFSVSALPPGTGLVKPNMSAGGRPVEYGPGTSKIDIDGRTYLLEEGSSDLGREALLRVLTGVRPAAPAVDPLKG